MMTCSIMGKILHRHFPAEDREDDKQAWEEKPKVGRL